MKRDSSISTPANTAPDRLQVQTRNALISVWIILIAAILNAIAVIYTIVTAPIPYWQNTAYLICTLLIPLGSAISLRALRRGQISASIRFLLVFLAVILILVTSLQSGFGLLFSISIVAITLALGGEALPARQFSWAIIISIVAGAAILWIELYWPFFRPAAPLFISQFAPALSAGVLLLVFVTVFRQFQAYALQTKLLLAFFLVSLIPLGIQALSNDNATRTVLTNTANQALSAAATRIADEIDDFFNSQINQLTIDAQLPTTISYMNLPGDLRAASSDLAQQTFQLLVTLARKTALPGGETSTAAPVYYLLDAQGVVVVSSDRSLVGQSAAKANYYTKPALELKPYVSPIEFVDSTRQANFYIAVPVVNLSAKLIGILVVRYNTDIIQSIVVDGNDLAGPQSFGAVFNIVDQNYIHIAHGLDASVIGSVVGPLDSATAQKLQSTHRLPAGPLEQLSTNLPDLNDHLLHGQEQRFFAAKDIGDQINQVAVAAIKSDQPWLVGFFQPQSVFLEPANIQTQNSVKLALAISLLVAAAAVGISQLLTGPIVRLTSSATRVTTGDFTARARVETNDEIGALASSFNQMTAQLQDLIGSLERRVEARTEQLNASAEVGRAAASILDTERLLREVVELITARFDFYYAAIFLSDEQQKWAVLHAATGEAGRILKERQHKLDISGQSMVGSAMTSRRARIALDVGSESTRFANPLLPETRSEIALPLIVGDQVLGALDVQSTQSAAFDETYAAVLQAMADQIAIALSNTRQFQQTELTLRQTRQLYEANREIAAAADPHEILQAIVQRVATDADRGTLILFGPTNEHGEYAYLESVATYTKHKEHVSIHPGLRYQLEQMPLAVTATPDKPVVIESLAQADDSIKRTMRILNTKATISLALTAGAKNLGSIVLGYRQPRHFTPDEIQTLQTVANQAAVTLRNQQLLTETQNALEQVDTINRRLTGQAWQTYTQNTGALESVAAGPGVSAITPAGLQAMALEPDQVKTLGPIGDVHSALVAPIALRGQVIGSLTLEETDQEREWTESEITLLQTVANEVAVAIENARLIEQTERRAERERIIIDINSRMLAANDLGDIVQIAGDELARVLKVARTKVEISADYVQASAEQDTLLN
jgi:GAF domain-containing protein/HAMP domain-containing protein